MNLLQVRSVFVNMGKNTVVRSEPSARRPPNPLETHYKNGFVEAAVSQSC